MKTPQEKLIEFMQWKHDQITEIFNNDNHDYFNEMDFEYLTELDYDLAEDVIFEMRSYVFNNHFSDAEMCPGCAIDRISDRESFIGHTPCDDCFYKENHGQCDEPHSTYSVIKNMLGSSIVYRIGQKEIESKFIDIFGE